jgi:hypothetical protein
MPMSEGFRAYLDSLRSILGLAAGVGALVPAAATFLTELAPPTSVVWGPIASALAVAALLVTYHYTPRTKRRKSGFPPLVHRALGVLLFSVILIFVYVSLLDLLTVQSGSGRRYQIGFFKSSIGLTEEGRAVKAAHGDRSPWQWMMNDALFDQGGPHVLWEWWAISLSALVLILVFLLAFVSWTHGWGLLAKHQAQVVRQDG